MTMGCGALSTGGPSSPSTGTLLTTRGGRRNFASFLGYGGGVLRKQRNPKLSMTPGAFLLPMVSDSFWLSLFLFSYFYYSPLSSLTLPRYHFLSQPY